MYTAILLGEDLKSGSSTADEDNDDGADDNDQHQHQNSIHLELTFRKFDNCNFISGFVCAFFFKDLLYNGKFSFVCIDEC